MAIYWVDSTIQESHDDASCCIRLKDLRERIFDLVSLMVKDCDCAEKRANHEGYEFIDAVCDPLDVAASCQRFKADLVELVAFMDSEFQEVQ